MTSKHLGIVVIGGNEGDRLIRCLESVRTVRTTKPFTLISAPLMGASRRQLDWE